MKTPLRVLIVEDCADDAELLLYELRRGGYAPVSERVETAQAMGDALARQDWDIVIADYSLPQFSGLAALTLVQERGFDLPFIIVSGAIGEDTAVAAMKAGAHDYLLKGKLARLVPAIERELREASERQRAALALQASERRFQSLIENTSGIIAVLEPDGTIGYVSPPVEPILGYRPEALIGTNITGYAHPEDHSNLVDFLAEVGRQPGVLLPVEFRIRHRDGSWRILGAMSRNRVDSPELRGIVINAQDITERRQLEEQFRQSQKMEAIGRLAGGVAHDFNNMLGAITGYSDILLHLVGPDEAMRECLQEIMNAAERAANLTRQLLLFSRKEVRTPQLLDLGEVVRGVQKLLERLIGEDVELVTISDPRPTLVKADPGQIEQIVMNLAINARDAMSEGGTITIETRNVDRDEADAAYAGTQPGSGHPQSGWMLLTVTDAGCGMDAATQARIFEPFFTTKEPGKGTGLGLSTVYGIVQQSGGYIQVESQAGQGATFKIYLPRAHEVVRREEAPDASAVPAAGGATILLVGHLP